MFTQLKNKAMVGWIKANHRFGARINKSVSDLLKDDELRRVIVEAWDEGVEDSERGHKLNLKFYEKYQEKWFVQIRMIWDLCATWETISDPADREEWFKRALEY